MKYVLVVLIVLCFNASRAQINTDSLIGKKYYINLRLAVSIVKEKDRLSSITYHPENIWMFSDFGVYNVYGKHEDCYKIYNKNGDTALLLLKNVREVIYDEYALITPASYAKLKAKYKTTFTKLLTGYTWIGMTREQLRISLGMPTRVNNTETATTYSEQYIYEGFSKDKYYYLTNGKLTAIQD